MTSHRKKIVEATTNTANEPSLSEQLHRGAYNYYSASQVESGDANFVKRSRQLLAAALLTSSSMIAMGVMPSTARASDSGTFACTTSDATPIDCTGTSGIQRRVAHANAFTTTINFDDETLIDTSGDVASAAKSDIGLFIYGYTRNTTVFHDGTITTGEIDDGSGIKGQQHGLYARAINWQMRTYNSGSITTEVAESHGLYSYTNSAFSRAGNSEEGTITISGDESFGVFAHSQSNNARASNAGTIVISGDGSAGVVALLDTPAGASNNSNASNSGTIHAYGEYNVGVLSDASSASAYGSLTSSSEINLSGDNSVGMSVLGGHSVRAYVDGTINVDGEGNSAGVLAASNYYGSVNVKGHGTIELRGEDSEDDDFNVGIAAGGKQTEVTLYSDNIIRSSGDHATIGVFAATQVRVAQNYYGVDIQDPTYAVVSNSGLIDLGTNLYSAENIGIWAEADTANVFNSGTITGEVNGDGIYASGGQTAYAKNTGTIELTDDSSITRGINLVASTLDGTATVSNTGDIVLDGNYSVGITATANAINITNGEDGLISGGNSALELDFVDVAEINNAGTLYGDVLGHSTDVASRAYVTNTGVIHGMVHMFDSSDHISYFDAETNFINDGGTVGNGQFAFWGGYDTDHVTITGTRNVINGALMDRGGEDNVLTFEQSDELVLNIAPKGTAIYGFNEINFDDGTTVFGEDADSIRGTRDSILSVNAGATMGVAGDHNLEVFTYQAIVRGGDGVRGTLSVPAGGFIDFDGDLTFAEGGRFLVGVAGDRNFGSLGADTITFDEGSEVYVDVTRNIELTDGGEMQIAQAIGGMTDNGVSIYDNTALFDFDYELRDGINFYLIVDHVLTALDTTTNASGTSNARNVAAAIDQFIESVPSDNPIVVYLAQFPVEEQQAALFQLVKDSLPTESGAESSATTTSTDAVIDLIMDRLSGGTTLAENGFGQGVAAGEQVLGGDGNWALWGRAGASFAKFTPSGVNGFDADTYAISLGIDGNVAPDIRMGVVGFYTSTDVDENGAGANSNQTIDGYGGFFYGSWTPNNSFVNVTLGYQLNDYENHRLAAGSIHTAKFDGDQLMGSVEVGQIFDYGKWKVTPHVGLRANRVKLDGYTETGPVPISVSGQTITSVRGVLGVGATYSFDFDNGQKLTPEAYVRVIEELGNPNQSVTGTVVGGGTFVSQSTKRKDLTYAAGVGLRYTMSDTTSIRLLYDGQYQSDYREHAVSIAARFNF